VDGASGQRLLRWALIAAVAVLVSAPIDDAWHVAYGRDAVLFSPPHLLAIASSATLIIALTGGLGPSQARLDAPSHALRLLGAALVLAALVVPVMEYEADVPQFSPAWFLPLVTVAVVLSRPVAAQLLPGRWPLTQAALVYTVLHLALIVALAAGGFSTPSLPPIVAAAVVADVVAVRRWPLALQAAAVALAVHLAYVPWLDVAPHGVPVTGRELVLSVTVASIAGATATLVIRPGSRHSFQHGTAHGAAGLAVLLSLTGPVRPASAHDPGQGARRGEVDFQATVVDRNLHLNAVVRDVPCKLLGAPTIVARRAGMVRSEAMVRRRGCSFGGDLALPDDGRWFVYLALTGPEGELEGWLPVDVADSSQTSATRVLYQPPARSGGATQVLAGTALVAAAAVLLVGCLRNLAAAGAAKRAPVGCTWRRRD
jgi:hypothetical protein